MKSAKYGHLNTVSTVFLQICRTADRLQQDRPDEGSRGLRTLLEGFKRYRDVSPMKLLKLTRLDFVHLALKEADPATSNVTDLAMASGFSQMGKFSTEYKERFGESPSETLKA